MPKGIPNQPYTSEFKQMVAETMMQEKLSYRETEIKFGIGKHCCYEMFYFELATGLRRGELLGLKWSDINFRTGAIRIQRQVQRLDGKVQGTRLKTSNTYRTILVERDILEPGSQRKRLQRVLKDCGTEKIRFHDLRHTFATLALQNGVHVKTLSGLLEHYGAAFNLDTYGHISAQMRQDAAQNVGGFLWNHV